jgi:hypothetical protein
MPFSLLLNNSSEPEVKISWTTVVGWSVLLSVLALGVNLILIAVDDKIEIQNHYVYASVYVPGSHDPLFDSYGFFWPFNLLAGPICAIMIALTIKYISVNLANRNILLMGLVIGFVGYIPLLYFLYRAGSSIDHPEVGFPTLMVAIVQFELLATLVNAVRGVRRLTSCIFGFPLGMLVGMSVLNLPLGLVYMTVFWLLISPALLIGSTLQYFLTGQVFHNVLRFPATILSGGQFNNSN